MNAAPSPKASAKALRPKTLLILLAATLVAAGAWGYWRYLTHPPRPFIVRWQLARYLKSHAAPAVFTVDFPFPTKSEMGKGTTNASELVTGSRTGKEFDVLAHEYIDLKKSILVLERDADDVTATLADFKARLERQEKLLADAQQAGATNDLPSLQLQVKVLQARVQAYQKRQTNNTTLQEKQEALEPIVADLVDFQKTWESGGPVSQDSATRKLANARTRFIADIQSKLRAAPSYSSMYQLIGQELYVAKRLLESANPDHRRMGLSIAMQASYNAVDFAQNGWVAARICEGYVWPHLDLATDVNRRSTYNLENLINQCGQVFRQNNEPQNVIRNYEVFLAAAHSPLLADTARAQLGRLYAQNGEPKEALVYYKQIKNTNDANFRAIPREISRLEQQLKGKGK